MAEIEDSIRTNAKGPAKASGDAGSVEQHKLTDQIEADCYLASNIKLFEHVTNSGCQLIAPTQFIKAAK
jgi:hypothetical protein